MGKRTGRRAGAPNKDFVGFRSGKLLVVKRLTFGPHDHSKWLCICDCGKEHTLHQFSLRLGNSKSCGCSKGEFVSLAHRIENAAFNKIVTQYKSGAKRRNLSFDLSREEFANLTRQNCYYCGSPPSTTSKTKHDTLLYTGVDRKDNSLGYISSNCIPCCFICNKAKMTMSFEEFLAWIQKISRNLGLST